MSTPTEQRDAFGAEPGDVERPKQRQFPASGTFDLPLDSRPCELRDRAAAFGLPSLTDAEVLELLLRRCMGRGAATWSKVLLARWRSLRKVLGADRHALEAVIGRTAAIELCLLHEVTRRACAEELTKRDVVSSWTALLNYLRALLADQPREQFRVLFLNRKNHLLADEVMGEGTIDHAPVYPREVIRRALELGATALIMVHNHPSGDPTPSAADIEITRQVVEAAKALRITVHDHVVVGCEGTASFKALGLM